MASNGTVLEWLGPAPQGPAANAAANQPKPAVNQGRGSPIADLKQGKDQSPFKIRKPRALPQGVADSQDKDKAAPAQPAGAVHRPSLQAVSKPQKPGAAVAPAAAGVSAAGGAVSTGSIVRELVSSTGTGCAEALGLASNKPRGSLKATWRTRQVLSLQ